MVSHKCLFSSRFFLGGGAKSVIYQQSRQEYIFFNLLLNVLFCLVIILKPADKCIVACAV